MNRTYEEWLKYYENATKEQVIEDMILDIKEIERLNKECDTYMKIATNKDNIIKEVREYIEKNQGMIRGNFNGKEWVEQEFGLFCSPNELLEILDKEKQDEV